MALRRKRKTAHRRREELLKGVTRKISKEQREKCEGEITEEEVTQMKKKMRKGKAAGMDGLPNRVLAGVDFTDEWLRECLMRQGRGKR